MAARRKQMVCPPFPTWKSASLISCTFFWVLALFSFLGEKKVFFFFFKFQTDIKGRGGGGLIPSCWFKNLVQVTQRLALLPFLLQKK